MASIRDQPDQRGLGGLTIVVLGLPLEEVAHKELAGIEVLEHGGVRLEPGPLGSDLLPQRQPARRGACMQISPTLGAEQGARRWQLPQSARPAAHASMQHSRLVGTGWSNTILGACRRSTKPLVVMRAYFASPGLGTPGSWPTRW